MGRGAAYAHRVRDAGDGRSVWSVITNCGCAGPDLVASEADMQFAVCLHFMVPGEEFNAAQHGWQ